MQVPQITPPKSPPVSKTPFTLIELLIVVAIIAILAGMLLPALNKARASGQATACRGNFATLAKALVMYSNDNQDWLMPAFSNIVGGSSSTGRKTWWNSQDGMLIQYTGLKSDTSVPIGGAYGSVVSPLLCPSRAEVRSSAASSGGRKNGVGLNGHAFEVPFKINKVKYPTRSAYLTESMPDCTYAGYSNENGTSATTMRMVFPHGGGDAEADTAAFVATGPGSASFSMLDGHVEQLTRSKVPRQDAYGVTYEKAKASTLWNFYDPSADNSW